MAAAIVDGDRILVIRRQDNGKWEPPGGTLELGETIYDGLRREVREEIGLEVRPDRLTGVYKNMRHGIVALVFRCDHDGTAPTTSPEVTQTRWMTPDEINEHLDPAYACRLLDALESKGPAVRVHDGVEVLNAEDHG